METPALAKARCKKNASVGSSSATNMLPIPLMRCLESKENLHPLSTPLRDMAVKALIEPALSHVVQQPHQILVGMWFDPVIGDAHLAAFVNVQIMLGRGDHDH